MRYIFTMAFFFSSITRLFGAAAPIAEYKTVEIYNNLRAQVLAIRPEQVGATEKTQILAVLMETGYPKAVATLVSVVDGTASLYFSTGGGIIGGGENEKARAASKNLVQAASPFLKYMAKADNTPLPKEGYSRFYVVTRSGIFTAEFKEQDLGEGKAALSSLFYAAQDVITQIRLIEEQKRKNG